MSKLNAWFEKDKAMNIFVVLALITNFCLFVAILSLKWNEIDGNEQEEDNQIDFMKLFMVWLNVFILMFLLFHKKVMTTGSCGIVTFFSLALLGLNIAAVINFGILIKIVAQGNDLSQETVLPFNYDWLTLGVTLVTSLVYLIFYFAFNAKRAGIITAVLIFVECIIFAACAHIGDDFAVDTANAVVTLITTGLSVILWSGRVKINEQGRAEEFQDFWARDDLEEMQVMVSSQVNSKV